MIERRPPEADGGTVTRFGLVIAAEAVLVNRISGPHFESTSIGIKDGEITEIGREPAATPK